MSDTVPTARAGFEIQVNSASSTAVPSARTVPSCEEAPETRCKQRHSRRERPVAQAKSAYLVLAGVSVAMEAVRQA